MIALVPMINTVYNFTMCFVSKCILHFVLYNKKFGDQKYMYSAYVQIGNYATEF